MGVGSSAGSAGHVTGRSSPALSTASNPTTPCNSPRFEVNWAMLLEGSPCLVGESVREEQRSGSGPPRPRLAVGQTVILLHPPLPLTFVSIGMERGVQQNSRLAGGYPRPGPGAR